MKHKFDFEEHGTDLRTGELEFFCLKCQKKIASYMPNTKKPFWTDTTKKFIMKNKVFLAEYKKPCKNEN